jgi:hypothetical protein
LASLSLGIGIAPPRYLHSWSFGITPLGIGIPSLLVLASPLPRYWHPALSTSLSSVSVSLAFRHCRYQASVSLSCIRTAIHNTGSVSSSIGFVSLHSPYTPQYHRYSYTPTNLLYRNTQTFPAEQRSLQLYSSADRAGRNKIESVCIWGDLVRKLTDSLHRERKRLYTNERERK